MVTSYDGGLLWAFPVSFGEPTAPSSAPSTCLLSPQLCLASAQGPAGHHLHFGNYAVGNFWSLISRVSSIKSPCLPWAFSLKWLGSRKGETACWDLGATEVEGEWPPYQPDPSPLSWLLCPLRTSPAEGYWAQSMLTHHPHPFFSQNGPSLAGILLLSHNSYVMLRNSLDFCLLAWFWLENFVPRPLQETFIYPWSVHQSWSCLSFASPVDTLCLSWIFPHCQGPRWFLLTPSGPSLGHFQKKGAFYFLVLGNGPFPLSPGTTIRTPQR